MAYKRIIDCSETRFLESDANGKKNIVLRAPADVETGYTLTWPDAPPTQSSILVFAPDGTASFLPYPQGSTLVTTTPYTVVVEDRWIDVDDDVVGGAVEILLPAGSGNREISVKKLGSTGTVTLTPDGAETIDEDANLVISLQFDAPLIVWNGTEWFIR